ncbi:hypothetical protein [Undibacterium fentianense]|uniref:Uncharacterized protein n=1 Tax=Undibacterium fentianense TaxID=2828728 RepID=A0A941E2Z4_9BURK|nr:hypothetical protein [Undibacterium fentianense]MBR7800511.1 hypothetical protein [Undibacterium fentianense]
MLDYLQRMLTLAANKELQGIHFWASVYVSFVLCGTALHILRVRRWPSVTGRLLQLGIRPLGSLGINESGRTHQGFIPNALYEYEVGGQQYRGSELSIWKMSASGFLKKQYEILAILSGCRYAGTSSSLLQPKATA